MNSMFKIELSVKKQAALRCDELSKEGFRGLKFQSIKVSRLTPTFYL